MKAITHKELSKGDIISFSMFGKRIKVLEIEKIAYPIEEYILLSLNHITTITPTQLIYKHDKIQNE